MRFHSYLISLFGIILLLKSFISSFQIPTVIYNLADETPTGSLIGNIAENLTPDYAHKYTFLLISSIKFQYLTDFFKITPNGDLITLRHIDRDDTNDICGPLDCCSSVVCQIEANVILTRQWDTTWKQDYHPPKHSLVKDKHDPDEEEYRRNSVKLNVSNQKNIIRLYIRINDANDNPPRFMSTNLMKYDPSNKSHQLLNRPFIIYIREGDTSGFEGLPIASDADSEVNGIVMYKLIEQTSSGDPVKELRLNISMTYSHGNSISSHHLNPKLILLRSLDYEHLDDREIYATFYAIDGGDPSLTGSLSIIVRLLDMNDNPPIIQQYTATEQLITLPENTTMDDKPFFIVNATDADSGENGRLTYTFSPLANSLVPVKFNIDSRNGAITIREPLDYEIYSERQFILPIVVKDAGSPQLSSTTTIYVQIKDINDNIPTLVVQENMTVPEGQMFTKPIVRFYVRDEDEVSHGKITCKPIQLNTSHLHDKELIAGYDYLRLHPISDTVFFIFTKGIFDYEKIPRASILIECYDLADHIDHLETLNITQQLNEIQAQQQQHPQHPQQQPLKSYPLRITIAISDQNDNIPLFIQSKYYVQIPEHIPDGSFIMEIKAYDLDHDKGNLTSTTQLIIQLIDINDHLPKLLNSIYIDFIENQKINTFIDLIHLIDLDQNFNYSHQDQDQDRDQDPDQVQDQDHSMMMVYTNTPIYSFILQMKGYDPDYGANGTIIYQLNQYTNGSQYFYLNETTGKLYTNWLTHTYPPHHLDHDHAIQTNPSQIEPIEGIYHLKILLKDMGMPNSHPNISNTPLNNPDIGMYTDSNNNPNHNDGYLQSTIQRTYGNSIVYSGYTYSHLSPIHDLGYYDQCKLKMIE
ncbi:putative cadherin [Schistosoma mansoni]|uniref:putative cadherin n=1 Tax=Schistosoma mansoni TaxID=6183 RepID=UPI00022DBF69|nr:putative cadherin [Schistosoma mansoni]|eukprot:XP_018649622.1 putative cadherin [Schistosoma mansoni]